MDNLILDNFWKNKKVLITGHTGFKGSWLSMILSQRGAQLYGVSLKPERPSLFEVCEVSKLFAQSLFYDLRMSPVCKLLESIKPDFIFHLAAQAIVSSSYLKPKQTFEHNFLSTLNILEAVRDSKLNNLKAVIVVTSDKCYKNDDTGLPFGEDSPLGGLDPYSASKACVEILCDAYSNSFLKDRGIGVATVRAGNVIGGGDFAINRLVPDIFRAIEHSKTLDIRNISAIRPWQFVAEPLYGYLALAEKLFVSPLEYSGPWNFGPKKESMVSVREFLHFAKLLAPFDYREIPGTYREKNTLFLDSSKSNSKLSWSSWMSLQSSITLTMDWYKQYIQNPSDMKMITELQIRNVENQYLGSLHEFS